MTNKQYCTEILNIIGDVSIAADAIYQLGFDVYRKLGGQEDKPTIDTIYKELKQAISIWDNTNNLTITENGTYSILGKTIDVSVAGSVVIGDTLKFTSTGNSTIRLTNTNNNAPDMQYSLDNKQTWVLWDYSSISLADGETVYFKGNNPDGFSSEYKYSTFTMAGSLAASGNIMSLIDNGACNTLTIPNDYCFKVLFNGCTSLTAAPALPATTLTSYCYLYMFLNCSNLTSAPTTLPATTLTSYCYHLMFLGCSSLTNAPELPATTLANRCYAFMFRDCSNLISAPELPATTLADYCYGFMFAGCSSLTSAPELPATTLAESCYYLMFLGCSSLTSAPELPATTLASYCYYGTFGNCTNLTTAPVLPATTLAENCYESMFSGCSNLINAPELPARTLAASCYSYMFYNCISLTTAPLLPATTLANKCYFEMFHQCALTAAPVLSAPILVENCYATMFWGCLNLQYIKCLATDISATNCLANWTASISETGTFEKDRNTTWPYGISGIPQNWTVINN